MRTRTTASAALVGAVAGVAAVATLLVAGTASAQNTDLEEVGAALTVPVITELASQTSTYAVVTNVSSENRRLHINVVDGKTWRGQNFDCDVTGSETVLFIFRPRPQWKSELEFECTNFQTGEEEIFTDTLDTDAGFMFVALEDPNTGLTINENSIFGDATVVSFGQGAAYSVGALSFQGGSILNFDGDRDYRFDGEEYSQFPATLFTNFIAPTTAMQASYGVTGELILLTLDGSVGPTTDDLGPAAKFNITFYDDDERPFSASWLFCCFDIVDLEVIDDRFNRDSLGSSVGHMFMTPQIQQQPDATHDFLFDGGIGFDGMRRTPVHGWLVQSVFENFEAVAEGAVLQGSPRAMWARTLNQSTDPIIPSVGDVVTLATGSN